MPGPEWRYRPAMVGLPCRRVKSINVQFSKTINTVDLAYKLTFIDK
jgi:hypothetical protein